MLYVSAWEFCSFQKLSNGSCQPWKQQCFLCFASGAILSFPAPLGHLLVVTVTLLWKWEARWFCVLPTVSSVQFTCSVMSDSLWPHGVQHTSLPCPSPTPGACSNSCPLESVIPSNHLILVIPFSSCFQFFPASGSFPMSQFFASGGQRIGVSAPASVLAMNIRGWFHLGLTGLTSLLSKGLSRVFSNIAVQKH